MWDASIIRQNNNFSENSLTELTQEFFLAIIVIIFISIGAKDMKRRPLPVFLAAMFLCALVRELDSIFDNIFDGAWQTCVIFILTVLTFWLYSVKEYFIAELAVYIKQPSSGILLSGLLTIMVFSRFFGRELLWLEIMGDGFMRSVKNAVEESVELFGYFLCLISGIEFFLNDYYEGNIDAVDCDLNENHAGIAEKQNVKTLI